MIDLSLTPEQELIVETVREYAARELQPVIAELDREARYDPGTFARYADLGLAGICFPERYGGAGLDYVSLGLVCEELEYVDGSFRTLLSIHVALCGCGIYQWGTEEQRQRFLVPLARGERLGAFGLTEPDAGSDVGAIRTRARKDGPDYVLTGRKLWISGADQADTFLVFACTDPDAGRRPMSAFVVERSEAKGTLSTFTIHDKAGIRAGNVGGLDLDGVRVSRDHLLGEEGEGFKVAMSCLDNGRFSVAAGAAGTIRACLDASVRYARERETFGKPIAEHQLVQEMIAGMTAGYETARLLYLRAGWLKNQGIRSTRESSLAKWLNTAAALDAANDAVEIFGAYGFSNEYPVARFLRNAKGPVIYEGTRQIHKLLQAEYALGLRQDKPLRRPLPAYQHGAPAAAPSV